MKTIAIVAIVAALATTLFVMYPTDTLDADTKFTNFVASYNKNYASVEEFNFRKAIFAEQLKIVEDFNAQGRSWTLGINEFSDWTDEEYKKMLGYKAHSNTVPKDGDFPVNCPHVQYEQMFGIDYRTQGLVSDVKNQGKCGSCWAFSAVGALEGAYAKKYGELKTFSEQQLVECDKFSHGCNGGLMENGFIHWMRNPPRLEDDYVYTSPSVQECQEHSIPTDIPEVEYGWRVDIGWECVWDALQHGVVSVAIRAENPVFRAYSGGVIDGDECGSDLDHGVTLVGYDYTNDAWIVKNSWGATWGEDGYVRIKRGTDGYGICGINQQNSQVTFDASEWEK